jgi:hypothetical protein
MYILYLKHMITQLFKDQEKYFDIPTSNLTPAQIRDNLAKLAASVIGDTKAKEAHELITLKGSPNGGNDVTDDLKYTSMIFNMYVLTCLLTFIIVKFSRQNGIHVSPTVLLDGLEQKQISSSWGEKEWKDFLQSSVAP